MDLVLLFIGAVVGVVLSVDIVVALAFNARGQSTGEGVALVVLASAATLTAIGLAAL